MADPQDNNTPSNPGSMTPGDKAIIERLKAEGDLIRNTGTNSIKSLNVSFEKFNGIFQNITNILNEQTAILRESLGIQKTEMASEKVQEKIKSVENTDNKTDETKITEILDKILKDKLGGNEEEKPNRMGQIGDVVKSAAGNAMWIALAPALGKIASNLVEEAGKRMDIPKGAIDAFANAADFATMFGVIGSSFGAKWGARGAVAGAGFGLASSFGDQVLAASGIDGDQIVQIFGQKMQLKTIVEDVSGALGGAVGFALSDPGIWKKMFSGEGGIAGMAGRASLSTAVAAGIASLYIAYGDDAKNWLEKQGVSHDWANTAVTTGFYASEGATLGSIFGPEGALVGAAVGLAIGLGVSIYDWFQNTKQDAIAKAKKDLEDISVMSGDIKTADDVQQLQDKLAGVLAQKQYDPKDLAKAEKDYNTAMDRLKTENPSLYQQMSSRWTGKQTGGEQAASVAANVSTGSAEDKLYKYFINAFNAAGKENQEIWLKDKSGDTLSNDLYLSEQAVQDPSWAKLEDTPEYTKILNKAVSDILAGKSNSSAITPNANASQAAFGPRIDRTASASELLGPRIDKIKTAASPITSNLMSVVAPTYGGATINNYYGGDSNSSVNVLGSGGGSGISDYFSSLYGMHRAAQ